MKWQRSGKETYTVEQGYQKLNASWYRSFQIASTSSFVWLHAGTFDGIEDSIWFEEDLLAEKNRTTFDLAIFLAKLRLLTHDQGIFAFYVEADVKKPAVNVIYVGQLNALLKPVA